MRLYKFRHYPEQDEVAAVEDRLSRRSRDRGSGEARKARSIAVPKVNHCPIVEAWVGADVCAQVRAAVAILVDPEARLRVATGGAEYAEAAVVARVGGRTAMFCIHCAPSTAFHRDEEFGILCTLLHVVYTPGTN